MQLLKNIFFDLDSILRPFPAIFLISAQIFISKLKCSLAKYNKGFMIFFIP